MTLAFYVIVLGSDLLPPGVTPLTSFCPPGNANLIRFVSWLTCSTAHDLELLGEQHIARELKCLCRRVSRI